MKLASIIQGEGEPLVILHGLFGMPDNWKTLAGDFAEQFEVHLIDQRNHGRSPHSDEHNYTVMAEDLLEYFEEHGIDKGHVMGHSMGGKTAMRFAMDHPERVDKLVVVDIGPQFYPIHHREILDALLSVDLERAQSRREAQNQLAQGIKDIGIQQFLLKNLHWVEKESLGWRFNLHGLNDQISNVGEALGNGEVYEGPTLFIAGGDSDYIDGGTFAHIREHFTQAVVETVEGAGHWVHAQRPKELFSLVLEFLG
ncbi:MAG: alpha/beta fold hydrolase [Flavobacteriales bacterium]|nr:alpha/beta fold hydrolase [Flavobacteriales bacterium]